MSDIGSSIDAVTGEPSNPATGLAPGDTPQNVIALVAKSFPSDAWMLDLPGVAQILMQAASYDWQAPQLQAAIQNTSWWETTTAAQRAYEDLQYSDPSALDFNDSGSQASQTQAIVMAAAGQQGVTLDAGQAQQLATQYMQYGWDSQQLQQAIGSTVVYSPTGGTVTNVGTQQAPPPNQYAIGQVVNQSTGESITSEVYSPTFGWLDLTSEGGVYTGGGGNGTSIGATQYGGSYLGYVNLIGESNKALAEANQAGIGTNGTGALGFSTGRIVLNADGSYSLFNNSNQSYNFSAPAQDVAQANPTTTTATSSPIDTASGLVQQLQGIAANYYQQPSAQVLQQWAQQIAGGTATQNNFQMQMQQDAMQHYTSLAPQLQSGFNMQQLTSGMRSTIANTMEVDPDTIDFNDPTYNQILNYTAPGSNTPSMMTTSEATQYLKGTQGWQYTQNARDSYAGLAMTIDQAFGKIGGTLPS